MRLDEMSLAATNTTVPGGPPKHAGIIKKAGSVLDWIHKNSVHAVIIGGAAVVNYLDGGRDLTPDLDFLVPEVRTIIDKLNHDQIKWQQLAGEEGIFGGIQVMAYDADFLDATQGNRVLNNYILSTAINQMVGGQQFPMIEPHVLVVQKFSNRRDKDDNDAFKLLTKPGLLNKARFKQVLRDLRNAVPVNDIKDYIHMISG